MKTLYIILILGLGLICFNCDNNTEKGLKMKYDNLNNVSKDTWNKLLEKKIFFGHQSVGNNIMDGVKAIINENPEIQLRILENKDQFDNKTGFFMHLKVGENQKPDTKIDDFKNILGNHLSNNIDYAILKFCFVDIEKDTDINKLFDNYNQMVKEINKKYPRLTIVHTTVPLIRKEPTSLAIKLKKMIKKVIGKSDSGFFDNRHNVKRNIFNEMIREKYKSLAPIYDLALIESTYPDGRRETFKYDGKTYYAIVPTYTKDAGHLHGIGRKKAAEQFLLTLASLVGN